MKVFISYSRHDEGAVRSMVGDLQRARVQVWLDEELGGGDAWWTAILNEIRDCTVFLFALSDNSLYSKPCRAELGYAQALGLPILPVQIGEVSSYRADPIFSRQLIDYRKPTAATGFALMGALNEHASHHTDLPDPLPEAPPIPYEYLQRLGASIHDPAMLTPAVQAQMVFELRNALGDEDEPTVLDDIRNLLRTLRGRNDVTARIEREIDTILGNDEPGINQTPAGLRLRDVETIGSQPAAIPASAATAPEAPPAKATAEEPPPSEASAEDIPNKAEADARSLASRAPTAPVADVAESQESTEALSNTDVGTEPTSPVGSDAPKSGSPTTMEDRPATSAPPTETTPSEQMPFYQRLNSRTKIVLGMVALFVVVAVTVVAIVLGSKSSSGGGSASPISTTEVTSFSSTAAPITTPTTTPAADPTTQRLLNAVPSDLHCVSATPNRNQGTQGAAAAVHCGGAGAPLNLTCALFPDLATLNSTFDTDIHGHGVTFLPCPGMGQSPQEWHRRATPQQSEGNVACLKLSGTDPQVYWTVDSQLVFAWARAALGDESVDAVFQWWAAHYQ